MKLEFLWIEKLFVIKEQGFNFNPNAIYTFDSVTGELLRTERTGICDDFFKIGKGVISNITALVGANGTGKSTILEFIAGFLTSGNSSGGIMVTDKFVLAKINTKVILSERWQGTKPEILDKFQISNYSRLRDPNTSEREKRNLAIRNSNLHILGNVENETLLTYYSGDINTEHTNRVYQNLLSLQDEFESSFYLDLSDVSQISGDMRKANPDKAIYAGVDPILAYRSGESKRFLSFINSPYRKLIPFSIDPITINIKFIDIDSVFFTSYDEIAFKPLSNAVKRELQHNKKVNKSLLGK